MSVWIAYIGIGKDEALHSTTINFLEDEDNYDTPETDNDLSVGLDATIDGKETKILTDWKFFLVELFANAPSKLETLLKKHQKQYIIIRC